MTNVVIGAASGMGAAVARQLAARGPLLIADQNPAGLEQIATELGGDVEAVVCDVTDQAQVDALFVKVEELGALVHTAGISGSMAPGRRILEVNLNGAVLCARHALAHFVARGGGGNIVNCSSVHQIIPKPGYLAYSISKSAMAGLTRTLALEFAGRGIRVNSVGPGAVETPINAAWTGDPVKRAVVESHIPMGRVASPEEIAGVFAFLASPEASYITGQTLYACGGITLFGEFRDSWAS